MESLQRKGFETVDGGGGGNFFRSALLRWKVDVLHLHWLHPYIIRDSWFASAIRGLRLIVELIILRIAGKRLIWTVHNLHNHQGQYRRVERCVCRWVARIAAGVICHSDFAADVASRAYKIRRDKITVCPHPIWQKHGNVVSRNEARDTIGVQETKCVFLFFGRVAPYKGIEDLISAFSSLDNQDSVLLIAGGPMSDEYSEQIQAAASMDQRIKTTLRFIDDNEIADLVIAADVLVFPFKEILTSGSLLLAMEFGKPCIAPAIGAVPETLPHEQECLTYSPEEPHGLANALAKAATMGNDLAQIGERNKQRSQNWTWDLLAETCAELYCKDFTAPC